MEVIVANLMTEISVRLSMRVIAFGSGNGCHAKCLFYADLLGKSRGHGPRRAKVDQHFSPITTACKPHGSQHRKNTTWTLQAVGVL